MVSSPPMTKTRASGTPADAAQKDYIRLNFDGGDVIVTPGDEDRFVITAQNAVEACKESHLKNQALQIFKMELLAPLNEWCTKHEQEIDSCYIPMSYRQVQVFVITKSQKYDFVLGEALSALELFFVDKGWRISILQLPKSEEEELHTFFNIKESILVYAKLQAAPGKSNP